MLDFHLTAVALKVIIFNPSQMFSNLYQLETFPEPEI